MSSLKALDMYIALNVLIFSFGRFVKTCTDVTHTGVLLQLRLLDGTRMVARFNTTHTVADIRGFIDAARPGSTGPYQLQTMGFPPVKLTDSKQTIEGAGLLNAVVIQKA